MRLGDLLLAIWDGDYDTSAEVAFEDRTGKIHVIERVDMFKTTPEIVFIEGGYEPPEHPA